MFFLGKSATGSVLFCKWELVQASQLPMTHIYGKSERGLLQGASQTHGEEQLNPGDVKEPFRTGRESKPEAGAHVQTCCYSKSKELSLRWPGGDCDPSQADCWQGRDRED